MNTILITILFSLIDILILKKERVGRLLDVRYTKMRIRVQQECRGSRRRLKEVLVPADSAYFQPLWPCRLCNKSIRQLKYNSWHSYVEN